MAILNQGVLRDRPRPRLGWGRLSSGEAVEAIFFTRADGLNGAGVGRIADVVLVNAAANWFHAATAVVCVISGMSNTASKQLIYD